MSQPIQALIFDFDGLILDTESSLVKAWQTIYDEYGLTISIPEWARMLGHSSDPPEAYQVLESSLGLRLDRKALRERRIQLELNLLRHQEPMPGVETLIADALAAGLQLAVASSSHHEWVDPHLERLGLRGAFDAVVCAEDVIATKPAPDLYLLALERLRLEPSQAVALEDSELGVRAARTAGLICVAVPNEITRSANFKQAQLLLESLKGVRLESLLDKLVQSGGTH